MFENEFVAQFGLCNRCGWKSLETLNTHNYCVNCNYSADLESFAQVDAVPQWALKDLRANTPVQLQLVTPAAQRSSK